MTPDEAAVVFAFVHPQIVMESASTRKVLAAVPADRCSYCPDDRSMNGLALAKHLAVTERMFLRTVLTGEFQRPSPSEGDSLATPADITAYYDASVLPLHKELESLSREQLARKILAFGMELPAMTLLNLQLKHSIHHRGQLSAYLRAMGSKVPAIYGGSADEPMTPPKKAEQS